MVETEEQIISKFDMLDDKAKGQAKKMSAFQLTKLSLQIKAIYNLSCMGCKQKMVNTPDKVKYIEHFCSRCQAEPRLINCFKRLEELNNDIS